MPLALKILEMSKAGASVLACASYFQCVLLGETSLTTKRTEGGTKFTKYFPFRIFFISRKVHELESFPTLLRIVPMK